MTATRESLETLLMERALGDPELAEATDAVPDRPILPDVTIVKVGRAPCRWQRPTRGR